MIIGVLILIMVYFLGAIPFGWIVGRLRGIDIRVVGSGNIGAANVARALGLRWAALVLLLDAAKGALGVAFVNAYFVGHPAHARWVALAMLVAVSGHVFSIFLHFSGGKGVATALGVLAVVQPLAALGGLMVYGSLRALGRASAVGSLAGAFAALLTLAILGTSRPIILSFFVICLLILFRHGDNLRRLWHP
ncbi:MAG: glycerol-3-phosphate acyltransferase [Deltaproteobacteria bacterium]|nr:glycerol-3-phosphate acyltransferase [Deltaproteobacteria bacterium]